MVVRILPLLLLAGCAAPSSNQVALPLNSAVATESASTFTCQSPGHLVCEEVLGSRVSRQIKDCVCVP